MGAEAPCSLVLGGGAPTAGKALLESEELVFRPRDKGGPRLTVPLASIKSISAAAGVLTVTWAGQRAAFMIGDVAAKWLEKIKNPKTRADKLGVKAGQRVTLQGAGAEDKSFAKELAGRGAEVVARVEARGEVDALFYWVSTRSDVSRDKLTVLQKKIKKDGAIWIIRPKGSPDISERDVYTAAREAHLVDVKVVAFSATHTAEKMVIPVDRR